ncbi:MAG: hypothetical protein II201_04980, partial [Clostridia bacterium]|nr:hypothetical protein [Clostridia bacterium]
INNKKGSTSKGEGRKIIMEELKTVIKVIGEINLEMLHNFLEETDKIMEAKAQYDDEMQLIKSGDEYQRRTQS